MKRRLKMGLLILEMAHVMKNMSCCSRGRHCCILTDRRLRILSTGFNGPASNLPNRCLRPKEEGNCGCVHAEANAVVQLASRDVHFAFVTGGPCEYCAQLLVGAGVRCVIYDRSTSSFEKGGAYVLRNAGVGMVQIGELTAGVLEIP